MFLQKGKDPARRWKRLRYCCRGRLWLKNVFSALPTLPPVLPVPRQTLGRSALSPLRHRHGAPCKSLLCLHLSRAASQGLNSASVLMVLQSHCSGKGEKSQPRRGPRSVPSPVASRGRMGSLIPCSPEFEQGSRQQQAAARSLRNLCHLRICLGSLRPWLDGPGQDPERPAWPLCCFQMGSQPVPFALNINLHISSRPRPFTHRSQRNWEAQRQRGKRRGQPATVSCAASSRQSWALAPLHTLRFSYAKGKTQPAPEYWRRI